MRAWRVWRVYKVERVYRIWRVYMVVCLDYGPGPCDKVAPMIEGAQREVAV